MVAIKAFIEQIIYISIIAIIIELILPKGNTKRYVYVILSLYVLLNIMSPVINIISDTSMQEVFDNVLETISTNTETTNTNTIEEFSEYKNIKITETVREELNKDIKEKLSDQNIELKELDIVINDDYSFAKLKVTIENLDRLKDDKVQKISDTITMLAKEYNIDEDVITIIEEGE